MRVSDRNAIVQNINFINVQQETEFVPIVETMSRNAGSHGMMACMIMGLMMAFMPNPVSASHDLHELQLDQEELILQSIRTAPITQNLLRRQMYERLDHMRTLQEGWVSGGLPIVPSAIDYSEKIIAHCSEKDLEHWNIGPYVNGTVMMNYRADGKLSAINIGKSTVSAFMKVGTSYEAFQKPADECFDAVMELIRALNC